LTTIIVKAVNSRFFSAEFAESMACPQNCEVAGEVLLLWPAGRTGRAQRPGAAIGLIGRMGN